MKELESSVEKEVIEQIRRTIDAVMIFPSFRNRPLSVLDHFPVMPKNLRLLTVFHFLLHLQAPPPVMDISHLVRKRVSDALIL